MMESHLLTCRPLETVRDLDHLLGFFRIRAVEPTADLAARVEGV
jgi:hypothetical protein